MLPLLTYKIFCYKRDHLKPLGGKPVMVKQQKVLVKHQCRCDKRKHIKKPTILEFSVVLFGIFGIPLSYIAYSHVFRWNKWNSTLINNDTVNIHENSSVFEAVSLSMLSLMAERMKNKAKYKFNHSLTSIDRREDLSMEEFYDMYSGKWPVIITDCVKKCPAFKKWNKEFFLNYYGRELVTVKTSSDGTQETFAMPLGLYLSHIDEAYPHQWTYLNDEMFLPSRPHLEEDIVSCKELNEDFFKLFPIEVRPWWSFLLWGTKYSRSDLHIDPFNWTGTNMVIRGLKNWKLFPPGQDHLLHVIPHQQYKFPMNFHKYNSYVDCFNRSHLQLYPSIRQAKVIEFYQYPGELLIIPTGWFHQAFNEEATLAVSGQVMNRDNYQYILEEIFKGGDITREGYPYNIHDMELEEQIVNVLSKISNETINKGRETTLMMFDQLKELAKSSGLPPPPLFFDRF